jgi:2-polyprenyl-3-methyl-5-hydroxy-6-metoxy-1,4-benzoquinol methylase
VVPIHVSNNLTEQAYWDKFWKNPFGASASHLSYHYHAVSRILRRSCPPGGAALELGCGGSVWLPTLAAAGIDTWGIDYSENGVRMAEEVLRRWRVTATVVKGDVFDAAALPASRFDLVFSLGLLEHFDDPAPLVRRMLALCRPGGLVVTSVPNLSGLWGRLQRRLDPEIYAAHRVYTPAELDAVHTREGLRPEAAARYFGGITPLLVNYNAVLGTLPGVVAKGAFAGLWGMQQVLSWGLAPLPDAVSNPPSTAGHILGSYRRPA